MIKRRHIFSLLGVAATTLFLTGCQKAVVLNPKGPVAQDEKDLFLLAVGLMMIVVIPVIALTLFIAYRYRASNKKAKYTPDWSHSIKLELIWWGIPIVLIAVLAVVTWITTHKLDPYRKLDVPGKPLVIQAISLRWKWVFIYPQQGIATVNYVQFPVDRQVSFYITSDAPMNSFQIQQLAGQIYAMNGMQTKMHLMADHTGDYRGRSVSFSGNGFSDMRFTTKVTTAAQFDQWVSHVKDGSNALTMDAYNQLVKPTENVKPMFFSSVTDNLFQKVIMKFMKHRHVTQPHHPGVTL